MILIGEKINGVIPAVKAAIEAREPGEIIRRVKAQENAGADYLDCAPSTDTALEYDAMCWLLDVIQDSTRLPICIDSPNAALLARILKEGRVRVPGIVNSVNEAGDKCETIFPLIAGTDWLVIGLTCDQLGIPAQVDKKVEIARSIIDKADRFGVAREKLHIDPCVMSLPTCPTAMLDFENCIREIKAYAPSVKITGAISNISFQMPARKAVNACCMTLAIRAGLCSAILDPCDRDLLTAVYAAEALSMRDKGGRAFNRAFRRGIIGPRPLQKNP
jgi:5-methyltetrahydrofolate corrinoid/iron sulfur protein methyltransferase